LNCIRDYFLLGALQGFTEFLPVSSSGHLVLLQHILGIREGQLALSVFLHLGTVCSLLFFFFREIAGVFADRRLFVRLLLTTVITGCIGLAGKDFFEGLFSSPFAVASALLVTAAILIASRGFMRGSKEGLGFKDAVILGVTQGIAVIPGISRSGATITTLLFRGLKKEKAFTFSFLAGLPVMLAAAFLEGRQVLGVVRQAPLAALSGFLSSFLCGIAALWFLKAAVAKARLHYFGYYCIIVAILTFLFIR